MSGMAAFSTGTQVGEPERRRVNRERRQILNAVADFPLIDSRFWKDIRARFPQDVEVQFRGLHPDADSLIMQDDGFECLTRLYFLIKEEGSVSYSQRLWASVRGRFAKGRKPEIEEIKVTEF